MFVVGNHDLNPPPCEVRMYVRMSGKHTYLEIYRYVCMSGFVVLLEEMSPNLSRLGETASGCLGSLCLL